MVGGGKTILDYNLDEEMIEENLEAFITMKNEDLNANNIHSYDSYDPITNTPFSLSLNKILLETTFDEFSESVEKSLYDVVESMQK